MTSSPANRKMREEATCSISQQLMKEPVSVNCGHSFCRQCIDNITGQQNLVTSFIWQARCPLCKTSLQRESVRPNKHLENLIESVTELEHERLCEEHGEQLHLFCEDDGQLICLLCERSPQHRGHCTALAEDVYPGYKEKLQDIVTKLKGMQKLCKSAKLFTTEQITEWEENIALRRQEIQSEFRNVHNFLDEEERAYLWRLKKEEEKLLGRWYYRKASLDYQSRELERLLLELAQNLLQDVKDTLNRYSDVKLKLPETFCLDPQTVCHVPELYFDVKKMLRHFQDTAHCELILSEDRRYVTRGGSQEKYFSSTRFCFLPCVLGCEGFTSGRHYFEVDVGAGSGWDLGVCLENVRRKKDMTPEPQSGFWAIRHCQKNGYMALTFPPTSLAMRERPLLVGVFLAVRLDLCPFTA